MYPIPFVGVALTSLSSESIISSTIMEDAPTSSGNALRVARQSLPIVAIIGRPNVGKSTLFNRLIGRRLAIEDSSPKTTRDRVRSPLELPDETVMLMDTGGVTDDTTNRIEEQTQSQMNLAFERADLILFVVSLEDGLTSKDREIADRLRTSDKPFVFTANKKDAAESDYTIHEFYELGLDRPIAVSALARRGLDELKQQIQRELETGSSARTTDQPVMALTGRQNVGKSTFLNTLARRERAIVTETPGTTRDLLSVEVHVENQPWSLLDTPGVEREGNENTTADLWSQKRVRSSIRFADVMLHLIDATMDITRVDQTIAEMAMEHHKPYLLVLNKWDLVPEDVTPQDYSEYLYEAVPGTEHCPVSIVSALENLNVYDTVLFGVDLYEQGGLQVDRETLTEAVQNIVDDHKPPGDADTRPGPDVYRAEQVDTHPPVIRIEVADPGRYPRNYRRYLENQLRETVPFSEIPFRLEIVEGS